MRKQKLNRTLMLMGTALMTLGVCGCAPIEDEYWEDEPTDFAETVDVSDQNGSPCEDCAVSDDFLVNQFSQTSETDDSYTLTDEDIMAMSRPVGAGKVSVKEKQERQSIENVENKIIYTSLPMPEKTTVTKTTTDVIVKTTPAEEVKEEANVEVKEETKVEVAKEEVATEVKAEPTVDVVAEEVEMMPIAESQLEGVSDQTETVEHQITTDTVTGKIVKEIDVPLKKTVTTITETTTKVKKEKKVSQNPTTLMEKLEYGESIQEWEAKSGDTLRSLLIKWSGKTGWTVVWKLDRDYHLEAGVIFKGTFADVSAALIRSFARATPAPIGTFYKGNRVLVITTQEDENER